MANVAQSRDRLFNPHGRRHYRRRYSRTEFRLGLAILAALGVIGTWTAWMGANPDPALFANAELLDPGSSPRDRGALPDGLASDVYAETEVSRFGADNLYEKINGRASFFLTRGFQELHFLSLLHEHDSDASIDLELYDLGSTENALDAFGAEKPGSHEGSDPTAEGAQELDGGGLWRSTGNALFVARGRYYLRAVAGTDSPEVQAHLLHVKRRLTDSIAAGDRPWAHALFGELNMAAGDVRFHRENAFSFGFAKRVFSAATNADQTEFFVVATPDPSAADALRSKFEQGFASYGAVAKQGETTFVVDRYLGTLASVATVGTLVLGVRGAPPEAAADELTRLLSAARGLSPEILAKAMASAEAEGKSTSVDGSEALPEESEGAESDLNNTGSPNTIEAPHIDEQAHE